ncbi:PREDICTED: uncharacterized protein LOC109243658 [Nicotiana attenuata]|uniref:Uncharacterized protein n=1 Tax=Nicotiana attenuata TaxID=49451 RepID=A0A314L0Q2_NICAT|nr:PREDICTED: uncharacterized protein LOC109243658 [Nicotiana attenuata]OIT35216.1 hypothetical protein A4A49_27837 [Nicotiana attenuata]
MKASIKFREEQKPLIRAKVPLSILNVPFQSGIVAGESKELSLNLGTLFDSGPSFKFAYRPNDSVNPFSFVFKTGIGHFGSPISSPFTMSAEFNLIGNQNPSFFIHFKPNFGDFCVKKSHSSSALTKSLSSKSNGVNGVGPIHDGFETPLVKPAFLGGKVGVLPPESAVPGAVENLFSGTAVSARTSFPVRNRAVVNFRWGLRFPTVSPAEDPDTVILGKNDVFSQAGISFRQCPLLVMNKIGIEHVAKDLSKKGKNVPENADLAKVCLDVKQQLETIQAENGLLRNALNDLRSEISSRKFNFSTNELNGKGTEDNANEELKKKKASVGATGA